MQIDHIAIAKLESSEANVRRIGRERGLRELADSIAAHGLIASLTVRKAKRGKYEVVAGSRRLAALKILVEDGTFEADVAIPCRVLAKENASEISLAENEVRQAMHVADAVSAYAALIEQGVSVEAIAQRFGQAVTTVRRNLKLAALSPRLLDELRSDAMTVAQAQALAVSDDHAAQDAAWFEGTGHWQREPRALRHRLTEEQETGGSTLARFVGIEAYEAAGGHVTRDLFAEDADAALMDRALLATLAEAKLAEEAERVQAEGWKWAEARSDTDGIWRMKRLSQVLRMTDEHAAEENRLAEAYEQREAMLMEQGGEDAVADDDEIGRLSDRLEELQATRYGYDPAEMALAGCVVTLGYGGEVTVHRGFVCKEDEAALAALQVEPAGEAGASVTRLPASVSEKDATGYSAALVEDLTAERTAALRVALGHNPTIALVALLHPLVLQLFDHTRYSYGRQHSAVEVRGERKQLELAGGERSEAKAHREWAAVIEGWGYRVPGDPGEVWPWLMEQTEMELHSLLAVCVAANLNAVVAKHDRSPTRLENADQIARALDFDMTPWFEADERFLKRLNRRQIVLAIEDAGVDKATFDRISVKKKAEAVTLAAEALQGRGWLPKPLRLSPEDGGDVDLPVTVRRALDDDTTAPAGDVPEAES
ncbi:ParB/RepB/Spo0J family partition protein [Marinivivus vitaminiproducens]|uniref:ParB/RepB/Spo0J family partition protein n=1 Tax=Marinivivus vitaminiproducens TaxID=3035935 RepID=UPI002799551D|nr:ParB/RepB/Spo0J family partition protein [Geminicoccaceae bacterium SCSIO 64248]